MLITPIHTRLGNIAYGTSPGEGEIHLTLRSYLDRDMDLLIQKTEHIIHGMACQEGLKTEISYTEIFPATKNNLECIRFVDKACNENELVSEYLENHFDGRKILDTLQPNFPGHFSDWARELTNPHCTIPISIFLMNLSYRNYSI